MKRVITLIGKWQMNSGYFKLLYLSQKQSNSISTSNRWFQELTNVGQVYTVTILPSSIIRGLTNKSIFTGNDKLVSDMHSMALVQKNHRGVCDMHYAQFVPLITPCVHVKQTKNSLCMRGWPCETRPRTLLVRYIIASHSYSLQ